RWGVGGGGGVSWVVHVSKHIPVLLKEVIDLLDPKPGETVVDCTAGLGGHAAAMAERGGPKGTVVLMDLDPLNLDVAANRIRALPEAPRVVPIHASFAQAARLVAACDPARATSANIVLADLGFASPQVDNPERGFSFMREGPLDMRLDPGAPITAGELVNTMPERDLAELIMKHGEEPPFIARRIAEKVVQERRAGPIQTTVRLAEVVRSAIPAARAAESSIHPATRTFQALRIAVNDEIGSLERLLDSVERAATRVAAGKDTWLAPGARVGIIGFHSLEDRPVKQGFGRLVEKGLAEPVTKKPVVAGDAEIAGNPRARSAKLRVVRLGSAG
nr:16S rRNA (cytosine(1402)-N(4))-methyltransferase RsmH [Phycisphaerales bacterium]